VGYFDEKIGPQWWLLCSTEVVTTVATNVPRPVAGGNDGVAGGVAMVGVGGVGVFPTAPPFGSPAAFAACMNCSLWRAIGFLDSLGGSK
jgi:hypothetical protein